MCYAHGNPGCWEVMPPISQREGYPHWPTCGDNPGEIVGTGVTMGSQSCYALHKEE